MTATPALDLTSIIASALDNETPARATARVLVRKLGANRAAILVVDETNGYDNGETLDYLYEVRDAIIDLSAEEHQQRAEGRF